MLFQCYVFVVRFQKSKDTVRPPTLIWKYAWFFLWHRFFWTVGRGVLSVFREVKPLCGDELTPQAIRHYECFNELAGRDFRALSLQGKIMQPTKYALAEDTAKELCLFYACIADAAPWQYGVDARKKACKWMRGTFFATLVAFISLCTVYDSSSSLYAWSAYWLFMALMLTGFGWYTDSALHTMAEEGERLRALNKLQHPN